MLKIDKKSKKQEATITFCEKDCFWNAILIKAFVGAVLFHFFAGVLFHVKGFFPGSSFLFKPVRVQISQPIGQEMTVLNSSPLIVKNEFPLLDLYQPTLPEKDENVLIPNQKSEISIPLTDFPVASQSLPSPYYPITLNISGQLANRQLFQNDVLDLINTPKIKEGPLTEQQVIFAVRVDPSSGQIFWFEKMRSSGQNEVDESMEQLLLRLKFNSNHSLENTYGLIEFNLRTSKAL